MQSRASFTGFKFLNTIESDKGIINGIVIISEGLSKNDDYYDKPFLSQLVAKGNESEVGVPSRLGHPSQVESKPVGFIGRYKNFRLQEGEPAKVLADLHLDPLTRDIDFSSKLSVWDYVLRLSETAPDSFGNSVNFWYKTSTAVYVDENGNPVGEGELGFEKPVDLLSFDFSDLVDVPAATTSLFESYNNRNNNKKFNSMSEKTQDQVIKDLNAQLSIYRKALDLELTLADGTAINVVQDTPEPAPLSEGDQVQLSDGSPAPDANHILSDGRIITTEGGEIINIESGDSEDQSESEDKAPTGDAFESRFKAIEDQLKSYQESINKAVGNLAKKVNGVQFSKQPSTGVPSKANETEASESVTKEGLRERIRNRRLNKNK